MVIEKSETVQCSKTYTLVHKQIDADGTWPETHIHATLNTMTVSPERIFTFNSDILINVSLNNHIQYI